MQRKKVLLCCNRSLNIGGIEKALGTFLKTFDTTKYDVTLVLANPDGVLTKDLPQNKIHMFFTNTVRASEALKEDIKTFRLLSVLKGLWCRVMVRINKNWYARIMYSYRAIEEKLCFADRYDCAISFTTDYSDLGMVMNANTDKRIAFVHADASRNPYIAKLNDKLLRKMDKIYCVSESSKRQFLQVHPKCKRQMDIFHNILLEDEIRQKAEYPIEDMKETQGVVLCTVGRLAVEKGQLLIPDTVQKLKEKECRVCWYLVGEGSLRTELEAEIERVGVGDSVILLGAKENPYPYMKQCDIYVQTSITEAHCITLAEARVLEKVIVTTDFSSIEEQITDRENGLIAEKWPESLAEKIYEAIIHFEVYKNKFSVNNRMDREAGKELEKLYCYIDGKE